MATSPQVTVGDRTFTLPTINGFKAVRAARLVAEASKCVPQVLDALGELRQKYGEQNALVVTPALAKLPRFQRVIVDENGDEQEVPLFTEADFEAAGGEIRIPQDPSVADQLLAVFPIVFEAAEAQVIELMALLISPNSELADADENGTVDDYLAKHARRLLHEASVDQLVTLGTVAIEQVTSALTADGGAALERAMGAVTGTGSRPANSNETQTSTPESQTDSPAPTDGADGTLSISHHGAKPEPSSTG